MWKDRLKGGLADNKDPLGFDMKSLLKGMKIEREHTKDVNLTKEIAMDHLTEDPKYYDKLEKMEKSAFWKPFVKVARELTTKTRNKLPVGDFVFEKERRYPIHDESHARNALARVAQYGTAAEKSKVKAAVHSKYPHIGA